MNLRKLRYLILLYAAFDFFIGGKCGGFLDLDIAAAAQFTVVSGTVTDPNGIPYSNGTITAALVSSASPFFTATNQPYTPPTQPVGLSSAGSFVMQLADNTQLSPGGSTWSFTVNCGSGCVPPGFGKGQITFTVTGVTISGASQSITATLTAAAPALTSVVGGGGSGTVNSGTATQIAFYSASTNAVVSNPRLTDNGAQLTYTGASGISISGGGGLTTGGPVSAASASFTGTAQANQFQWNATVLPHNFFGNNTGSSAAPAMAALTTGDLPPTTVLSPVSGATNVLAKYSAAAGIANSLLTDNGTTLSYTGTAGISSPALTDTGVTGSTQCLQANSSGTVSGAGSPCGTATLPSGSQGNPLINTNGSASYGTSAVYLDVKAFLPNPVSSDLSLGTQPCIQALSALGGTCDARGVTVAASGQTQTQAIIPTSSIPSAGTLLIPVGWVRQVNALVCPNHWHCVLSGSHQIVTGGNATGGTVLGVAAGYRAGCGVTAGLSACTGGNATFSGTTLTLTNSVLTSADVGTIFYLPQGGGSGSSALRVTSVTNGTTATVVLESGAASQTGVTYSQRNVVAWMGNSSNPGSSPDFAVSIENGVIDPGGLAGVGGIINMSAQEQSYVRSVSFTDYLDVALLLDSSGAQNSGPYDLLSFNAGPQAGGACNVNTTDAIFRVVGGNRIELSNSTFTHTNCTSGAVAVSVEDEAIGMSLRNLHFEGCVGCNASLIAINIAGGITCPVGCATANTVNAHATVINGVNASGAGTVGNCGVSSTCGAAVINIGNATPGVQQSISILNVFANTLWPNLIQDPNNACNVIQAGSAGAVGQYFINVDGSLGYSSTNGSPTAANGCSENYAGPNATSLTNGAGGPINVGGGKSTGTGLGGYLRLQTVIPSTTSGTTLNNLMGRVTIAGHATASPTSASAITIGQFGNGTGSNNDFITNTTAHGEIVFGVTLSNPGTANCTLAATQPYAIENTGGTVVVTLGTQTLSATSCTAGNTFTSVTFALTAAHPSVLTYTPTFVTIVPTIARISYEVHDFGEADYVPQ